MCWKWHQMSTLVERSGADEVKPSLTPVSDEDRRPHSQTGNTGQTSTSRTARCGPACRVVWEGRGRKASPYPNLHLFGSENDAGSELDLARLTVGSYGGD